MQIYLVFVIMKAVIKKKAQQILEKCFVTDCIYKI